MPSEQCIGHIGQFTLCRPHSSDLQRSAVHIAITQKIQAPQHGREVYLATAHPQLSRIYVGIQ